MTRDVKMTREAPCHGDGGRTPLVSTEHGLALSSRVHQHLHQGHHSGAELSYIGLMCGKVFCVN